MSSPEFSLLYRISATGGPELEALAASQRKLALEAKYSSEQLKGFDAVLQNLKTSGLSYGQALSQIAAQSKASPQAALNKQIANDIIKADQAIAASSRATTEQIVSDSRKRIEATTVETRAKRLESQVGADAGRLARVSQISQPTSAQAAISGLVSAQSAISAQQILEMHRAESVAAKEAEREAVQSAQVKMGAAREASAAASAAAVESSRITEASARAEAETVAAAKLAEAEAAAKEARTAILLSEEKARAAKAAYGEEVAAAKLASAEKIKTDVAENASHRRLVNQLKSTSVLAGVHDARALDSIIGGVGGSAAIAGLGAAAAVGFFANLVKGAAEGARELQNFANEMGITAQQAFKLRSAAEVSGVELGTMGAAARKLALAIEEPGGAGKQTVTQLNAMGISLRQGLGGVLEQTIAKLAAIEDPAKRAQVAIAAFGRDGARIGAVAPEIEKAKDSIGDLSDTTQKKLLEAEESIKKFGVAWTLIKGQIAAAAISINNDNPQVNIINALGNLALGRDKKPVPFKRFGPEELPGDATKLNKLLGDDSRSGLDERIAEAKAAKDKAEATARNDAASRQPDHILEEDYKNVKKLREEYEKLEKQKKAANTDPERTFDRRNLENQNRLLSLRLTPDERQVSQLEGQRQLFQFDLARDKNITPAERATLSKQNEQIFSQEAIQATRNIVDQRHEKQFSTDQIKLEQGLDEQERRARRGEAFARLQSADPTGDPSLVNLAFKSQMDAAGRRFAGTNQNIDKAFTGTGEDTAEKKRHEQEVALYKYIETQDNARIDRDIALGEIQKRRQDIEKNATREISRINDRAKVDALQQQFGKQERLDELNAGERPGTDLVLRSMNRRLEIAKAIHAEQLRDNESLAQDEGSTIEALARKRVADAQSYRDFEHETNQARMDAELRIAELRKQSLDQAKEGAGQLYDAIRNHSTGDFFRSQFNQIGKNAFENVTAPIMQNVFGSITKNLPNTGIFKDAFKGTLFDAKDPATFTKANTDATAENTEATLKLRDAMKGIGSAPDASDEPSDGSPKPESHSRIAPDLGLGKLNNALTHNIPGLSSLERVLRSTADGLLGNQKHRSMDEKLALDPNSLDAGTGIALSHLHRTIRNGLADGLNATEGQSGDDLLRQSYRDLIQADADLKESLDALTVAMGGTPAKGSSGTSATTNNSNSLVSSLQTILGGTSSTSTTTNRNNIQGPAQQDGGSAAAQVTLPGIVASGSSSSPLLNFGGIVSPETGTSTPRVSPAEKMDSNIGYIGEGESIIPDATNTGALKAILGSADFAGFPVPGDNGPDVSAQKAPYTAITHDAFGRFLGSAVSAVNPIPALREWWNRPSEIGKAMSALPVLDEQIAGKQLTDAENRTVSDAMNAHLTTAEDATPLYTGPAMAAMGQAAEGDRAGALGTLAGAYALPYHLGKLATGGPKNLSMRSILGDETGEIAYRSTPQKGPIELNDQGILYTTPNLQYSIVSRPVSTTPPAFGSLSEPADLASAAPLSSIGAQAKQSLLLTGLASLPSASTSPNITESRSTLDSFSNLENQYNLPSGILGGIYSAESARGKYVDSPKGAKGPFQLMDSTAKDLGVTDPYDIEQAAPAAAKYMGGLLTHFDGDTNKSLAAYNWGMGNVDRNGMDNLPQETRQYVDKVSAALPPSLPTPRTDELASAGPLRQIVQSVNAPAPIQPAPQTQSQTFPALSGLLASLAPLTSAASRSLPSQSPLRSVGSALAQSAPVVRQIGQLVHPQRITQQAHIPHAITIPQVGQSRTPQRATLPTPPAVSGPRIDLSPIVSNTQATGINTQALNALTAALINEAQNCGCKPGSGQRGTASVPSSIRIPSIGGSGTATGASPINLGGLLGSISGGSTPDVSSDVSVINSAIKYTGLGDDATNGLGASVKSYFGGSTIDPSDPTTWMSDPNTLFPVPPSFDSYPSGLNMLGQQGSDAVMGNYGITPGDLTNLAGPSAGPNFGSIFGSGGALPPSALQKGLGIFQGITGGLLSGASGGGGGLLGKSGSDSVMSEFGISGDDLSQLTDSVGPDFGSGFSGGGMLGQAGSDSVMSEFGITSGDLSQLSGPEAGPDANSFAGAGEVAKTGGLSLGGVLGAAGGTYQAIKGFGKGGGQGIASGVGGTLEAAGSIAMMIPGGQLVGIGLEVAGMAANIVSSLFGDPRKNYEKKETRQIENAQQAAFPYTQPGLHIDESTNGRVTTTDFQGNVQELNAIPTVGTETRAAGFDPLHPDRLVASSIRTVNDTTPTGLVDLFHPENSTGSAANSTPSAASYAPPSPTSYTPANSGASTQPMGDLNIHLHNSAMDSQDVMRRSKDIASAVQSAILNSNHPLGRYLSDRVLPR